jgi:ubiquinone/menaquinone biosynthesis C-methylase UbiE
MSTPNNATQLHLMNPLTRFCDRASDYARYRPNYPQEAVEVILQGLPLPIVAADIGAGTGISSRLLAQQKVKVIAIEPNVAMRQAAESHQLVEFRDGTAEATHLPNHSVNLVTCFQSFHWFNPETTLAEFHRILKPSGRLALVWNERDRQDTFTSEYIQLIREVSKDYPIESLRLKSVEPLFATPHFVNFQKHEFAYKQALDLSGLIGCASSASYVPREGTLRQYLIAKLQELYDCSCDKQGLVYIIYRTDVHLAEAQIN